MLHGHQMCILMIKLFVVGIVMMKLNVEQSHLKMLIHLLNMLVIIIKK